MRTLCDRLRICARRRFLAFEIFESRICLAWTVSTEDGGATLILQDLAGHDNISNFTLDGGIIKYQATVGGILTTFSTGIADTNITTIKVHGSAGNDTINVSAVPAFTNEVWFWLSGEGGNDTIYGPPKRNATTNAGHLLIGGVNDDTIYGGNGNDIFWGLGGTDDMYGGDGEDYFQSFGGDGDREPDDDWIEGGNDDDTIYGGDDADTLFGGPGNDKIYGNKGNDVIYGDADHDKIYGGDGNDTIHGGAGVDWTYSNETSTDFDQPYDTIGGTPGWYDMAGSGGAGCDIEDGHIECDLNAIAGIIGYGGYLDVDAPGVLAKHTGLGWTAEWRSNGTYGTVTVNSDGSFRYSVPVAPPSSDTFQYALSDGTSSSHPATATLNLTNPAPTAVNDGGASYTASGAGYGNNFNFPSVLNNDTWTPGEWRQISGSPGYTQPSVGSVTMNSDGSFTFMRPYFWTGTTSFTYYAHDFVQNSGSYATVTITLTNPLMFAGEEAENPTSETITLEQAQAVMIAAGQSWIAAGLSSAALNAALAGVTIVITDLPGAQLAGVADRVIYLDANAAGYGWHLDTSGDEVAAGQVDLLTALRHEIGHLLGLEHSEEEEEHGGLMDHELGLGTRRSVSAADAALAQWLWEQEE